MKKKPFIDDDNMTIYEENQDDFFDINKMASANDCTGLVPTPPLDDEQADSYTKMYEIPTPAEEDAEKINSSKENLND